MPSARNPKVAKQAGPILAVWALSAVALTAMMACLSVFAAGQDSKAATSVEQEKLAHRSLERVRSRADFDELSRVFYRGRFYALPHVMFVIDRQDHDRIYYINSKMYEFHKDFVNGTYLSLERGMAFYENNYLKSNRRFILGTVAYQTAADEFSFEFWEGDEITRELLAESYAALARTFYAPVFFKPNSQDQGKAAEAVSHDLPSSMSGLRALGVLTRAELSEDLKYEPLNLATGIGQLRIIDRITPDTVIDKNQIVIFREVPVHITPLSGIITTEPASPLSHTNMLAKGWGIPNAYIKNADKLFSSLEGKYVRLQVAEDGYQLTPANPRDVEARQKQWVKRADLVTPPADLTYSSLTDLRNQRAVDSIRFGAKSANLGELIHARIAGFEVPAGFSIPFYYYREFLARNNLEDRIQSTVEDDRFVHDPKYRKQRLSEIRDWIQNGALNERLKQAVLAKAHREFAGKGLFVRSSTNSEDLPNFSGAGLYTTVPNVKTDAQLIEAIKTVWASIWNYEAYEARESFGMNHFGVYPAVLVQEGINADSAGVVITSDPFNPSASDIARGPFVALPSSSESRAAMKPESTQGSTTTAVYINAKRGLGSKVVEGKKVSEQVLFRPANGAIQVLTRSGEDTMLKFDSNGGLKEVKIDPERQVLTDEMVRRLAAAAIEIKRVFNERDQDIEWVYSAGRLYIVQSRPFIEGR